MTSDVRSSSNNIAPSQTMPYAKLAPTATSIFNYSLQIAESIKYTFLNRHNMFSTANKSVRMKEPNPPTMSLYSRGSMQSSPQNSATWEPAPIIHLPSRNGAERHTTPPRSILNGSLVLPPPVPLNTATPEI
jgi:hypothetical protein